MEYFVKLSTCLKLFSLRSCGLLLLISSTGMWWQTCTIRWAPAFPGLATPVLPQFPRTITEASISAPVQWGQWIHVGWSQPFPQVILPGHRGLVQRRTQGPAEPVSSFLRTLEFVIRVRFASLKVWALKLKPQKLSVASSITFGKKSNGIWFVRREKEGQCRCVGWQNWGEITSSHEFVILVFLGTYLQIHLCILWETSIALQ